MPNIYLKHPRHGSKIAISIMEAREDIDNGWEEYDPDEDDLDTPASAEMSASEDSSIGNLLRAHRRRRS
jgi:hypothetical protein